MTLMGMRWNQAFDYRLAMSTTRWIKAPRLARRRNSPPGLSQQMRKTRGMGERGESQDGGQGDFRVWCEKFDLIGLPTVRRAHGLPFALVPAIPSARDSHQARLH